MAELRAKVVSGQMRVGVRKACLEGPCGVQTGFRNFPIDAKDAPRNNAPMTSFQLGSRCLAVRLLGRLRHRADRLAECARPQFRLGLPTKDFHAQSPVVRLIPPFRSDSPQHRT